MNRGDMREQVQFFIGDTTTAVFADADHDNQLNRVMPSFAAYMEELETDAVISTIVGQERYPLPINYIKVKKLELEADSDRKEPLTYKTHEEFKAHTYGSSTSQEEPRVYTIYHGSTDKTTDPQVPGEIALGPLPDAIYTLRLYFFKGPAPMSADSDFPELPEFTHMAICYKAAMHFAMRKGNRTLYADLEQLYRQERLDADRSFSRIQRDRAFLTPDHDGVSDYIFGVGDSSLGNDGGPT